MMNRFSLLLIIATLFHVGSACAQGDLDAARRSLGGISSFAVSTVTEGPQELAESDVVGATAVANRLTAHLREAGLPVASRSDSIPTLYVHLNLLALENGLVPFSIEVGLYQDVRLERSGQTLRAETWSESVVGLVSQDMLTVVSESVDALVDQFVEDFRSAR